MAADAKHLRLRERHKRQRRAATPAFARRRAAAAAQAERPPDTEVAIDCGWGRLLFAPTFRSPGALLAALRDEKSGRRDIGFHVTDPHVLVAAAPSELFIDPSHTYRLELSLYRRARARPRGFLVRRLTSESDAREVNRIYQSRGMVPVAPSFFWSQRDVRVITCLVAEDVATGAILGTVMGVDHVHAFHDPEGGSSLWCLAVDANAPHPGIGEALVRQLVDHYQARGCAYVDLSVLHDNDAAVALYERLGFRRVPLFAVKRKNSINESLFVGPQDVDELNPYARIIAAEAMRRGIHVEVFDVAGGFMRLTQGGRSVRCRESLSELTSAVAMSICDDKAATRRIVERAGVCVPEQMMAAKDGAEGERARRLEFLERHRRVVVKPARGEQGRGVAVGLTRIEDLDDAVRDARAAGSPVLIEQMVDGEDLRIVVIDYRVVAAAVRQRPAVIGDGRHTVAELIEHQSRRRAAATGGESRIPIDAQTTRLLAQAGRDLSTVLPPGKRIEVRGTANLHTGGTIHDVTEHLHPGLARAAVTVARAIDIPVVGVDFMVRSPIEPQYAFIEANERPGLANHEPRPTAERFVDLLFPQSAVRAA